MNQEEEAVNAFEQQALEENKLFDTNNLRVLFVEEAENFKEYTEEGAPFDNGLFLEKLWSAIDFLFRFGSGKTLSAEARKELEEAKRRLGEFYPQIFHGSFEGLEQKVRITQEMRNFAHSVGIQSGMLTISNINEFADRNDRWAEEELEKIREESSSSVAQEGKDLRADLNLGDVSPCTAISTLEDYRRLAKKRKSEKK